MKPSDNLQVSVTGETALQLPGYRHIFHLAVTFGMFMVTIAATVLIQSEQFDIVEMLTYSGMALVFLIGLMISVFLDSPRITHHVAIFVVILSNLTVTMLLVNYLFGAQSEHLASGRLPLFIAWMPITIIALFIYLPSKSALTLSLMLNNLVAIAGFFYAGQHWLSATYLAPLAFFTGQFALVNNLGIALLALHNMMENKASDYVNESVHSLKEVEAQASRMRFSDPLTGLLNAAGIQQALQESMAATAQIGKLTGLLVMKLDHQSETHEHMGEIEFQRLMRMIAAAVIKLAPEQAGTGRYEGSLFMLWLSDTDIQTIQSLAQALYEELDTLTAGENIPGGADWSIGGVTSQSIRDSRFLIDQALYELHKARHQRSSEKISIADFGPH